mmetsp:Transcript_38282/g.101612  ORF Transcript_38282/g.101612 Transcript_38282/m.101612 type:complete len:113 (-) Transcript_38282:275-613(-)
MAFPKLIVFDLDMCLWHPEMFQLSSSPSKWNKAENTITAGSDTIRMFPGAITAFRDIHTKEEFRDSIVAVASSTTEPGYAKKCLSLFEVLPGVKVGDIVKHSSNGLPKTHCL